MPGKRFASDMRRFHDTRFTPAWFVPARRAIVSPAALTISTRGGVLAACASRYSISAPLGPPSLAGKSVNKFRPGGLMIVRAGGDAGMFSGIIGGWSAGGPRGSLPVTKEVRP